jgi:hypothetical protein
MDGIDRAGILPGLVGDLEAVLRLLGGSRAGER